MHMEAFAQIHFGAELAVENTQVGPLNADRAGGIVGEAFGESFVEVVTHLTFQLNVAESHECKAYSDTGGIRISLPQTKIVGEHANLDVFSLLSGRERHEPAREKKKKCETLHGSRSPCDGKFRFLRTTDGLALGLEDCSVPQIRCPGIKGELRGGSRMRADAEGEFQD